MGRLTVEAYSKREEDKRQEDIQEGRNARESKGGREELTDTKKVQAFSKEGTHRE